MYGHPMSWEPVLDGHLADEARAAARAIALDLERIDPAQRSPVDEALMWAYVAGAFDDEATVSRFDDAIAALHRQLEAPDSPVGASLNLFGGLAGAGWVLAHISEGADEFLTEVDGALLEALREPWPLGFELIRGVTGLGVYFMERLRGGAVTARPGVVRVVEQLAAMAETSPDGTTWFTEPRLIPAWQLVWSPSGYYNLGVAHGVPGAIAYLGIVAALDDLGDPELAAAARQARELCEQAGRWLRARELPPHPQSRYSTVVTREPREPERSRTAWCYGDPGIAVALWSAAARTGADATAWRELALEAARRPPELCGVVDTPLCHGAVGLAHLYNRCFQASGDERFREAARDWFERTLAMRRPGEGIAGFTARRVRDPDADLTLEYQAVPAFLDGAIGVALALLAAVGGDEPGWDRMLLCDLPPRADRS
jgi:lantibiotic biosynthesis protein